MAEINDRYDLLAEDISHLVQLGMTEEATALMADEGALILGQVDDVIAEWVEFIEGLNDNWVNTAKATGQSKDLFSLVGMIANIRCV